MAQGPTIKAKTSAQSNQDTVLWNWVGWGGLLITCVLVYLPALNGAFLWDDNAHVTRPELRSLEGLARIWFELGATQQYYPVLHSAFWVEHRIWGDSVFGYHAWNVFLHALSAGLIVTLMRRLSISGAWLAGFIFALHPVCVESVAWISEQKNTLSTAFYLLAMLAYLRCDRLASGSSENDPQRSNRWRFYALASVLFLLAALTKTVTVTLPAALLVIFWWQRGKLTRRDITPLIPWFAFSIAAGLMTAWVERNYIGASGEAFDLNLWQRTLLAGQIVWFYLSKLLWPADLMFIYPRWDMTVTTFSRYLGLASAIGALIVCWRFRHRSRAPLATALLYGGTLFPALGFFNVFPFQFSYVADHFQYLASIAVIVTASAGLVNLSPKFLPKLPLIGAAACIGLLASLAFISNQQSRHYRDNITLYRITLAQNPACWLASYNLGLELAELGQTTEAIELYRDTLLIKPDYAEVHANLGIALTRLPGGLPEGIRELEIAVGLKPELHLAKNNLANLIADDPNRSKEAIALFKDVLRHDPAHAGVRFNLGRTLLRYPSRENEALFQFDKVAQLEPDYWQAHYQIGSILIRQRREFDRAIASFEEALRINPDMAEAHFRLGQLHTYTTGNRTEAIKHLRETLRLNPNHPQARGLLRTIDY